MSLGQYAVRVTCGLGLMLLPAVQQKLCTWPSPKPPRPPAVPASASIPTERSEKKSKKPLTLAALLPDGMLPRWPNHTHLAAIHRVRPLAKNTWMTGGWNADDERVGPAGFSALLAEARSRRLTLQRCAAFGYAVAPSANVCGHVFQTSILTTGPPRA